MEKYFAGEEITAEELKVALRKGTLESKIFPVLGGDSRSAMSKTLLDYITLCLPSPIDVPPVQEIILKLVRRLKENLMRKSHLLG